MKKYFAMMVAALFVFGIVGPGIAQQAGPAKAPIAEGQAKPDTAPVKKSEKSEKAQKMTPEKKKAAEAPGVAEGSAKPAGDIKGKKSEKSKKRQAETPEKKKMKEEESKAGIKGS